MMDVQTSAVVATPEQLSLYWPNLILQLERQVLQCPVLWPSCLCFTFRHILVAYPSCVTNVTYIQKRLL